MTDDEIEELIADLRGMLVETGFGWAAEQAELSLPPDAGRASRAAVLLRAAESVTVDLAEAEGEALVVLGVDDIEFRPESEDTEVDEAPQSRERRVKTGEDRLRGPQRRAALADLAGRRAPFAALRGLLDVNG